MRQPIENQKPKEKNKTKPNKLRTKKKCENFLKISIDQIEFIRLNI